MAALRRRNVPGAFGDKRYDGKNYDLEVFKILFQLDLTNMEVNADGAVAYMANVLTGQAQFIYVRLIQTFIGHPQDLTLEHIFQVFGAAFQRPGDVLHLRVELSKIKMRGSLDGYYSEFCAKYRLIFARGGQVADTANSCIIWDLIF